MNALTIGTYVERRAVTTNAIQTKPHLVESIINDEPVCHCGRTLKRFRWTDFYEADPATACKGCARR